MLNHKLSPTDTMVDTSLPGAVDHYFSVGRSGLSAIKRIVLEDVSSILDLPCGHGRVLRHLSHAYPSADLFASDLDEEGMRFCATSLGARALPSTKDFDQVNFGRQFALIWSGSLITHLNSREIFAFFRFIRRHLSASGVAIVTFHGAFVAGRLFDRADPIYGLRLEDERSVLKEYFATGFGYRAYPWIEDGSYGITLSSPEWVSRMASECGLTASDHRAHEWDNHQDVIALRPIG